MSAPKIRSAPRTGAWIVAASLTAFLVATLMPVYQAGATGRVQLLPSLADFLRNLLMLAPLGAGLALRGHPLGRVALAAVVLSVGVEMLQLVIPGRRGSPWDPLANTIGAVVGAALVRIAPYWHRPTRANAERATLAAALVAVLAASGSGWLLAPNLPPGPLFVHRTPHFEPMEVYRGQLEEVLLDGTRLVGPRAADPDAIRASLAGDYRLRLRARAGPAPKALAPLFAISDARQEILVRANVFRADLSCEIETRGAALGLEPLRIPARGALAQIGRGEAFELEIERSGPRLCVVSRAAADRDRRCQTPWSLAGGWRAYSPFAFGTDGARAMDAIWIALLLLPVGLWARRGPLSLLAAALLVGAALIAPVWLGLAPLGALDLLGAAGGLALGRSLRGRTPRAA